MPTTRRPDPRTAATRARLLDAAERELLARGGHLELQSVARAAGVVPSVASHHFGSRAGLVGAVVDRFFDALHAEVLDRELREHGDWLEREHERLRRGVRFYWTAPLAPVVLGGLTRDPSIAAIETRRIGRVVEAGARNMAAAQRAGELPRGIDPRLASASVFGAVRQVVVTALGPGRRPSQRAAVAHLWRITVAAVTPDQEPLP